MPKSAPEKVAVSPNATSSVSWICPCGSIKIPQKSKISPPIERTEAVISCVFGAMFMKFCAKIYQIWALLQMFWSWSVTYSRILC